MSSDRSRSKTAPTRASQLGSDITADETRDWLRFRCAKCARIHGVPAREDVDPYCCEEMMLPISPSAVRWESGALKDCMSSALEDLSRAIAMKDAFSTAHDRRALMRFLEEEIQKAIVAEPDVEPVETLEAIQASGCTCVDCAGAESVLAQVDRALAECFPERAESLSRELHRWQILSQAGER